jgi:hypothetical protein
LVAAAPSCPFGLAGPFAEGVVRGCASPPAGGDGWAAAQGLGIGGMPAIPAAKAWAIARDAVASHSGSAAMPANWSCHNSR